MSDTASNRALMPFFRLGLRDYSLLVLGRRAVFCAAVFAGPSWGQTTGSILKIPAGARATGMGSAFTAVADDASAIYWNQAGLASLVRKEVLAAHTQLFDDMRYDALAYAQPSQIGTFGFSLGYLAKGSINGRDDQGLPTGSASASDMTIGLGVGRRLTDQFSAGFGFKYIRSVIADTSASGMALDLGGIYRTAIRGLSLGASIQNMGQGLRFMNETDPLPLTTVVGASYAMFGGFLISADVRRLIHDNSTEFSLGAEYAVLPALSLRGGYLASGGRSTETSGGLSALTGLGAGLGLGLGNYRVDYAVTPFGELGNVQRLSLGARF